MSAVKTTGRKLRILAPTDLSVASRGGLRFAIQWARQQEAELLFVHVVNILKPASWSEQHYATYAVSERARYMQRLQQFVREVYRNAGARQKDHSYLLLESVSADIAIQDYCLQDGHIDYVCMSTKGAGRMKRIFGTHTGNLINHSKVPVLAVPANYRMRPMRRILYAGDLTNYEAEISQVINFARPLSARLDILHFRETGKVTPPIVTGKELGKHSEYSFRIYFREMDHSVPFAKNLERQISSFRPSVVVLFTNQDRSLFNKIFFPSRSESVAFALKAPLLVFPKG